MVNDIKYALHVLPSGLLSGRKSYIGNGMVLDLIQMEKELEEIQKLSGEDVSKLLKISDRVQLVLPLHSELDILHEEIKLGRASGSTKKGVGPSYADKINRMGIRFTDLFDEEELLSKIKLITNYHSKILPDNVDISAENIFQDLIRLRDKYQHLICDSGAELEEGLKKSENVLFEGAQSTLLDIDHGIYPFNTSSTCIAAGASLGSGVGIQYLNERIGVIKAFTSRVGGGPLMAELDYTIEPGKTLQAEGRFGGEFGTTSGRPRRMAWLDLVALRYSCRVNGYTGLAITKLDILGYIDRFSVIEKYENTKGDVIHSIFPARLSSYDEYKPVLRDFTSWEKYSKEEWEEMMRNGYSSFPEKLKQFITYLEEQLNTPIYLLGLGPERELTFEIKQLEW